MELVGGPWCGRQEPVQPGWPYPDVFSHLDLTGAYRRRGTTSLYDYDPDHDVTR